MTAIAGGVSRRATPALLGVAGLATFALVLEIAPRLGVVPAEYAPPTSRVLAAVADELGRPAFWTALLDTLVTWAIGLGIAVAAGLVAGLVIGTVPVLRAATATTVEFLRPIPSVALIPLVIVLYGSTIRVPTFASTPSRPVTRISAYTAGTAPPCCARSISLPRPGEPITSSPVTARMSATEAASRTPVTTYGRAVGQTRKRSRSQAPRPYERAVSRATGSTSATPYSTCTRTCQNAAYTTRTTVDRMVEP